MYTYSIMPLDDDKDHIDQIVADIREQTESRIADCILFKMTLVPEGNPVIDKAGEYLQTYDALKERLDAEGIETGVLVQASIGHGWPLDHMFPFQRYTNLTDGEETNTVCPLDEGFRSHFKSVMAAITKHKPKTIMVDDDFRLMFREGKGCACPLHMKLFHEISRTNLTREEIYKHTQGTSEEDKRMTDLFIETQRQALVGAARAYREGVDSVDEKMPVSFCACGPAAEFAGEIAKTLAGKNNPVIIRLNNGAYASRGTHYFSDISLRAASEVAVLKDDADALLAETDTCPQNRYSTSAQMVHAHYVATILEGAKGAKHWITKLNTYEPESGKAYRKILKKYSGMYEKLSEIVEGVTWLGLRMPVPSSPAYGFGACPTITQTNGWSSCVMERMGFPMYFSKDHGGAVFMDGPSDAFMDDDEVLKVLSGPVFLASDTAERLIARGFKKYLGVDVRKWEGVNTTGEILDDEKITSPQVKPYEIIIENEKVRMESVVFHLKDGKEKLPLFPGCTSFENELGGKVHVFSGTPKTIYNILEAFSFLSESRKKQLTRLLKAVDAIPVYFPGDEEMYMRLGKTREEKYMCVLYNLGLDIPDEIELSTDLNIQKAEIMQADGTISEIPFRRNENILTVQARAGVLDPVILFLS